MSQDPFAAQTFAETLFDALPEVVFFIKDTAGRYAKVNQTLADRCTGGDKTKLLGRLPSEIFPPALAQSYTRQDHQVVLTGRPVDHQLELHIYPRGITGWCLTTKHPLRDPQGRIIGIAGISRDLNAPSDKAQGLSQVAKALRFMRQHYAESLRIEDLAKTAKLSIYQFEQRLQRLFHMSPLQLLHKFRLDEATRLLRETDLPLGQIALQTGWCDQSAFTRYFGRYTGLAPGKYRSLNRE